MNSEAPLNISWSCQDLPGVAGADERLAVGVSAEGSRAVGVVVRALGQGLSVVVSPLFSAERELDHRLLRAWRNDQGIDVGNYLADVATEIVFQLADQCARFGDVLVTGVHGLGDWDGGARGETTYRELCHSTRLSDSTGITVVDDFPSRDLARHGCGGPLEAPGYWVLLADRSFVPGRRIRALLEIGPTVGLTLLPPRADGRSLPYLTYLNLGPNMSRMPDLAVGHAENRHIEEIDACGSDAVQGRKVPRLLELWSELFQPVPWRPGLETPAPVGAELDLTDGLGWSHEDVLCTGVHFVADSVQRAIRTRMPRSHPVGQILIAGSGQRNGFLIRELQQRLPEIELLPLDKLGIPTKSLRAAAAAILAIWQIDRVPANPPSLTGCDVPRVLGRLSPGCPANWQRVVTMLSQRMTERTTLRTAI